VAEVFVMYTLCSEIFLALGMGMAIELLPDAVQAGRELKRRLSISSGPGRDWGMLGSQNPVHEPRHPRPSRR